MAYDGSPSRDPASTVERVQRNSVMGSPLVVVPILVLLLGFVAWRLAVGLPQDVAPPDTTLPPIDTTLPDLPPAELGQLQDLGLKGTMAYGMFNGVAIIDLETGSVRPVTEISEISAQGEFEVLRADGTSFVINKSEPTSIGVSEIQGDIVSTTDTRRFVAVLFDGVAGGDPETDSRFAYTLSGNYGVEAIDLGLVTVSEIARDSAHILVPGLGAIFERPDGGTFIFDVNGYRPLSDYRVIAASATARVEVRCSTRCEPYFVSAENDFILPPLFEEDVELSVSPNGEWILLTVTRPTAGSTSVSQRGGSQIFRVSTQNLWSLGVSKEGPPRWASDSSFVGWLSTESTEPELVVVKMQDRRAVTVNLGPLGAPNRTGEEVVFINSVITDP